MYMHSFHVKRVVVVVAVEQHAFTTTRSKMQNARDIRLSSEVIVSVKFIELFFTLFFFPQSTKTPHNSRRQLLPHLLHKHKQSKQASKLVASLFFL